jgi:hypothetical protein
MSSFLPLCRATLLIPSGPAHNHAKKHLFIILTDPIADPLNENKDSVLLTSLSTLDVALPHDPTCILRPGEHPFISRDSYVSYHSSRIQEAVKITNGVASGVFVAKALMDSSIVDRICDGLTVSQHTTPKILRFFRIYTAMQQSD